MIDRLLARYYCGRCDKRRRYGESRTGNDREDYRNRRGGWRINERDRRGEDGDGGDAGGLSQKCSITPLLRSLTECLWDFNPREANENTETQDTTAVNENGERIEVSGHVLTSSFFLL